MMGSLQGIAEPANGAVAKAMPLTRTPDSPADMTIDGMLGTVHSNDRDSERFDCEGDPSFISSAGTKHKPHQAGGRRIRHHFY